MCVKFYSSRVRRMHKNVQLYIKLLLKKVFLQNFFILSDLLKTRDIFSPSMKFSLNYYQHNYIYALLKKMTFKYLFE